MSDMEENEIELRAIGIDPEHVKERVQREVDAHAQRLKVAPAAHAEVRLGVPPFCVPINSDKELVELVPGITVSTRLIEAVVGHVGAVAEERKVVEHRVQAWTQEVQQIRQDINASQQVVQEMVERAKMPLDFNEKYVSYDSMPAPLQRVIKAYVAMTEARTELDQAVKALQLEPPSQA